jgi:hypothetical protein
LEQLQKLSSDFHIVHVGLSEPDLEDSKAKKSSRRTKRGLL